MEEREHVVTKCSFSFRCTHAFRNTPHTCQKSCREGGADQQGDEEGGRQKKKGIEGEGMGHLWVENGDR